MGQKPIEGSNPSLSAIFNGTDTPLPTEPPPAPDAGRDAWCAGQQFQVWAASRDPCAGSLTPSGAPALIVIPASGVRSQGFQP